MDRHLISTLCDGSAHRRSADTDPGMAKLAPGHGGRRLPADYGRCGLLDAGWRSGLDLRIRMHVDMILAGFFDRKSVISPNGSVDAIFDSYYSRARRSCTPLHEE